MVGEKSDTCNINAESWVRLFFFQKLKWIKINNGSHMFPDRITRYNCRTFKTNYYMIIQGSFVL